MAHLLVWPSYDDNRGMLEVGRKNDPNFPPKKGFWGFLGSLGDALSKI
jgi:hypothetical protein